MIDRAAVLSPSPDPRVERTRTHVLEHARELLSANGLSALTYSELAARARVTRQTLYRHWPTRESLIVDLVLQQSMAGMPDAPGAPKEVVGQFLRRLRDDMDDPAYSGALIALIVVADHDPACSATLGYLNENVRGALNALLEPAGHDVTADEYARLCGPVIFGRFIARERVTDQFIDALVAAWSQQSSDIRRTGVQR